MEIQIYGYLFAGFAFVLGAIVGSFLNVCIHRMPLGLSVNSPSRSFCPHCKRQIPWHQNIPIFSWLFLRGKCAQCGAPISFRYFGVELLTALLFLAIWLRVPWILALPYWILAALLIVATFIDFEHFIIPDEITLGGTAAGVVLSFAIPVLMHEQSHLAGALWSLVGAGAGYLSLRTVVELGKIAFGKKRVVLEPAEAFVWTRHGDDAELKVGGEGSLWSDYFSRDDDRLVMRCTEAEVGGKKFGDTVLDFTFNRLVVGEEEFALETLGTISGVCREVTIPREAMGLGDVKFISAIGAFLGWQAVFFTVLTGSVLGALFGVGTILARRREWSAKIPFGPYLAVGALLWVFAGWEIVNWYFRQLLPVR